MVADPYNDAIPKLLRLGLLRQPANQPTNATLMILGLAESCEPGPGILNDFRQFALSKRSSAVDPCSMLIDPGDRGSCKPSRNDAPSGPVCAVLCL